MRASLNPLSRDRKRTMGSVKNMTKGRVQVVQIFFHVKRCSLSSIGPWRLEFASKSICNQEDHLSNSSSRLTHAESICERCEGVCVHAGVEVHEYLDNEDDTHNSPFLPEREAEAESVLAA